MYRIPRVTLFAAPLLIALSLAATACNKQDPWKTGAMMQNDAMDATKAHYARHHNDMIDNAILHDMSIADFHFVPHSNELSGTGVYRLDRMAPLLNTYGGTVRYETDLGAGELMEKRLAHVREYLRIAGCDMGRVDVKPMISGGRGMIAKKAIEIDAKGTVKPQAGGGPVSVTPSQGGAQN